MAASLTSAAAAMVPRAAAELSPAEHRRPGAGPEPRVVHFGGAAASAPKLHPLDLLDDEGSGPWTARSSAAPLAAQPPDGARGAAQLQGVLERLQHLSQQLGPLEQLPRQLAGVAGSQGRLERALGQLQQQLRMSSAAAAAGTRGAAPPARRAGEDGTPAVPAHTGDCEWEFDNDEPGLRAGAERAPAPDADEQASWERTPLIGREEGSVRGPMTAHVQGRAGRPGEASPRPSERAEAPEISRGAVSPGRSPAAVSAAQGSQGRRSSGSPRSSAPSTPSDGPAAEAPWGRQVTTGARGAAVGRRKSCMKDAPRGPDPGAAPDIEAGGEMDRMRSIAQSPVARSIVLRQRQDLDNSSHAPSRVNVRRATTTTGDSYTMLPHQRLCPMHPDHKPRMILDLVFVFMTAYDCWAVPYQMSWRVEYTGWFAVWTYFTLVWWTIDMFLGFFFGYYRKSRIEMRLSKIAWRYLRKDFGFNLVAVVADFIVLAMVSRRQYLGKEGFGLQVENVARICKVSRLIRMITLLLQRGGLSQFYNRVVNWLQERGLSRQFQAFNTVMQLVFLIFWVSHLGACFWHYVGRNAIATWYTSTEIDNASPGFDYLLCYYWSVSALISGGSIMEVTQSSEVLCLCVFIIFGLLFLSILISALAATVMDLNMSNKERKDKLRMLRRYFYQHQVEAPVAIPIEKQAIERMGNVARIRAGDVDVLAFVSPAMRAELRCCVYGPGLSRNAFIRAVNAVDSGIIKDLCFNERALMQMNYDPGNSVFEPDTDAPGAYFINFGSLEYTNAWTAEERSNATGATGNTRTDGQVQEVAQGQWVCELALHTQWMHCGWMEASTVCELLAVAADGLMKVLGSRKELLTIAQHYGEAIITATRREALGMLSDLRMAIDHESIITSMPLKSRIALSQGALKALDTSQHWGFLAGMQPRRDLYQLEQELRKGKCDIVISEEGRVLRVVSLCLARLTRADGRVLAELGDMKDGRLSMGCKLPGTKVRSQELPHDALRRFIRKQFAHLEPEKLVELEESLISQATREVNSEEKVSQNYGINSRYLRNEFRMQIESELFSQDGSRALARSSSRTSGRFGLRRIQGESAESLQVAQYEAFAKIDPEEPDKVTVMAWIDPGALAFLSSSAGDAKVRDWVYSLQHELAELFEGTPASSSAGNMARQGSLIGRRLSRKPPPMMAV